LDKEESKHADVAQKNGFGAPFLHRLLRLIKGIVNINTAR
jgi:hypothetical protein